jgi:hypothetical protein
MWKSRHLGRSTSARSQILRACQRWKGLDESPIAVHLLHDAGRNYTQTLASSRYSSYLAFWQMTCSSYGKGNSFLEAGGAKWPDTSKEIGANCVLR